MLVSPMVTISEQLTYLLFLKMAHERTRHPIVNLHVSRRVRLGKPVEREGDELETHYRHILAELAKQPGMLGIIFRKAQNKIQDPALLRRLIVDLIDQEPGRLWIPMSKAMHTKDYCRRMPKIPKVVQVNILPPVH